MAFVYRFKDTTDTVIYVGYTGQSLDQRMANHFQRGHLDPNCYKSIAVIEYKKYNTKADAQIMEVYYINKFKGKYNKLNKQTDNPSIEIEDNQDWKLYKQFKEVKPLKKHDTGYWKYIAWIYLLVMALLCLYNML